MEALSKAQKFFNENQTQVLIGLLVVVLLISVVWFTMFRSQATSPVLENKARVNEASTAPTEQLPTQEQLEEMARYREQMESQQPQADNAASE
jgi:uncharacterized membrane protein